MTFLTLSCWLREGRERKREGKEKRKS